MMFQISHTPGALADVLGVFKTNKLNLTWIESFPAKSQKPEYVFFADFEGHAEDAKVKKVLAALQEHSDQMYVLGSYPVATVSG